MTRRWMRKHRILTRACRTRTSVAALAVVMKFVFVCLETDHTKCEVAAESSLQEFLHRTDNMSLLPLEWNWKPCREVTAQMLPGELEAIQRAVAWLRTSHQTSLLVVERRSIESSIVPAQ
jgi:hypothetical protein